MVWRTPGADGGRDIEGMSFLHDLSGHELVQKWYIECKRYSTTLDWPAVYKKIAFADSHKADVLLVSTNSNPSPQCETEVARWNSGARRPLIRFWRGYDLPRIVNCYPHIGIAYGLIKNHEETNASMFSLTFLITKMAQAAFSAASFGSDNMLVLESISSLSELLSQRMDDLRRYKRLVPAPFATEGLQLPWADIDGITELWEEVGIRALLCVIRYFLKAKTLIVTVDGRKATVSSKGSELEIVGSSLEHLHTVAHWARAEIVVINSSSIQLIQRS